MLKYRYLKNIEPLYHYIGKGIFMGNYKNGLETRNHIYQTAKKLFISRGFSETTVRDIADAAGVKLGLINYYFGSKDDLGCAVHKELTDNLNRITEELFELDMPLTPEASIEYHVFSYMIYLEFFYQIPEAARLYSALCGTSKFPAALIQEFEFYINNITDLKIPGFYNEKLNHKVYFDILHSLLCGMEIQLMQDLISGRLNQPFHQAIDIYVNLYFQHIFNDSQMLAALVNSVRKRIEPLKYRFDENYDVVIENETIMC